MRKLITLVLILGLIFSTAFIVSANGVGFSQDDEETWGRLNFDPILLEASLERGEVEALNIGFKADTMFDHLYFGDYVTLENNSGFHLKDDSFFKANTTMAGYEVELGIVEVQAEIGVTALQWVTVGQSEFTPKLSLLYRFGNIFRVAPAPTSG